jgi:hypothetical protein
MQKDAVTAENMYRARGYDVRVFEEASSLKRRATGRKEEVEPV